MFEMKPYARKNAALYNPFRDMDEIITRWKQICRASRRRTSIWM